MKNVIYNQVALSQPLVGPLAVHIAPFAEWVNSKGYLARYTHRIAISNQRIIDIHNDNVLFTYKDYRDNQSKTLSLDYSEFIRRFLMHVLIKSVPNAAQSNRHLYNVLRTSYKCLDVN